MITLYKPIISYMQFLILYNYCTRIYYWTLFFFRIEHYYTYLFYSFYHMVAEIFILFIHHMVGVIPTSLISTWDHVLHRTLADEVYVGFVLSWSIFRTILTCLACSHLFCGAFLCTSPCIFLYMYRHYPCTTLVILLDFVTCDLCTLYKWHLSSFVYTHHCCLSSSSMYILYIFVYSVSVHCSDIYVSFGITCYMRL